MRLKLLVVAKALGAILIGVYLIFAYKASEGLQDRLPTRNDVRATRQSLQQLLHNYSDSIVLDSARYDNTKVKLIILTYMRSGSSFTGDLFNNHPSVFYVFEPLWSTQKYFNKGVPIHFIDKASAHPQHDQFYSPASAATSNLQSFLDCNFYSLDPRTLGQYHLSNSLTTRPYYKCQQKLPGILGAIRCLPLLFQSCRRAEVTSVKTIRFTMAQAARLMRSDPKVKVIHLIRDPRATLRSQAAVGEFKWMTDLHNASKVFCKRVLDDINESDRLRTLYPSRSLRIRYEDLATKPLHFAERLLAFAGLAMDDVLRKYVWNITSAGLPDNCVICTTRNDSRRTAAKWRTMVDLQSSMLIDINCADIYQRVGYLPFVEKQALKNWSVPSFVDPSKVPGLWG